MVIGITLKRLSYPRICRSVYNIFEKKTNQTRVAVHRSSNVYKDNIAHADIESLKYRTLQSKLNTYTPFSRIFWHEKGVHDI